MTEEEKIRQERDRKTAQKAADVVVKELKRKVRGKVGENVLVEFKEDLIKKLLERKPFSMLCDKSPDIFFHGLRGMEELTPYFSFRLSMIFSWQTGGVEVEKFK